LTETTTQRKTNR